MSEGTRRSRPYVKTTERPNVRNTPGEIPLLKNFVNLGGLTNPGMPARLLAYHLSTAGAFRRFLSCLGADAPSSAQLAERARSCQIDGRCLNLVTPEVGRQGGVSTVVREMLLLRSEGRCKPLQFRGKPRERTESASLDRRKNVRRHYFPLISSNAKFSSSTFTRGSPSKPNSRCAVCFLTSSRTVDSEIPRAVATRGI
jgi:hypothetical protein